MTKVAIVAEPSESGEPSFRAFSGEAQSVGRTAGQALDALTVKIPPDAQGTLIVVQRHFPDSLFTATQQARLQELMNCWRAARDAGHDLSNVEKEELEELVDAETRAAAERARLLMRRAAE